MANITTIVNEKKRGCGFRQPGGLYLVGPRLFEPCHRLPIPLTVCPTCHGGVHQARGWTWIIPETLFGGNCERFADGRQSHPHCERCAACAPSVERAGLLWVGEGFYKTPQHFMKEVLDLGVSRRVRNVPKDFKPGETLVYFAHPKAVILEDLTEKFEDQFFPGVFTAFRPAAVEYILKGNETEAEIERLEKRGLSLVRLVRTDGPKPETAQDELPLEGGGYVS